MTPTRSRRIYNMHQAKSQLSRLVDQAARGEEVVIARSGVPVARLVPITGSANRVLGTEAGKIVIAADFDAPLPAAVLRSFYK